MAGRAVKPALADRETKGNAYLGAKVRSALPDKKEGRRKKETRKPKRALGRRY